MQDAKNAEPPMISIIEASRISENRRKAVFLLEAKNRERKAGDRAELYNPWADCYNKATRKKSDTRDVWAKAAGFVASG